MTPYEIKEYLKAYAKRKKETLREQAIISFNHAYIIGQMFSGDGKIPQLHELYPGLFEPPAPQSDKQDWRVMKARIEAYSAQMKKQKGSGADGSNS
mgnify:CR=1 FL=1